MKRFVIITLLYNLINISLCAQEVFIYYEGPKVYSEKQYAYEFQSLIYTHSSENPIYEIKDSVFISFLDKKVESIERCTNEGDCFDATDKPIGTFFTKSIAKLGPDIAPIFLVFICLATIS